MTSKQTRAILPHLEGTLEYLEATSTFFGGRNWEPKFVTVARSALVVSKNKPAYEKGDYLEQVDLLQVGICEANIEGSSKQYIFKILGPGVDRSFSCKSLEELHNWINKLNNIKEHWTRSYESPLSRRTKNHSDLIENVIDEHKTRTVANGSAEMFQLTLHMKNNIQQTINLPKQHSTFHDLFHELSMKKNCPDCSSLLYCASKHGEIVHVEKDAPLYPYFKAGSTFFICEQQTEQQQQLIVVHINETYIACLMDTNVTSEALQNNTLVVEKMQNSIGKAVCMVLLYEEKASVEKKVELLAYDDKPLSFLYDESGEPKNSGRLVLQPVTEFLHDARGKCLSDEGVSATVADMSAEEAIQLERGEITFRAVRLSSGQIILEKCEIRSRNTGDHKDYNSNNDSCKNGLGPVVENWSKYPALSEESNMSKALEESRSSDLVDDTEDEGGASDIESYNNSAIKNESPNGNINDSDKHIEINNDDDKEVSSTNAPIVEDGGGIANAPEINHYSNGILPNETLNEHTVNIHRLDSYRTVIQKHMQNKDPKPGEIPSNDVVGAEDASNENDGDLSVDDSATFGEGNVTDGSVGDGGEQDDDSSAVCEGADVAVVNGVDVSVPFSSPSQVGIGTDISDEVVEAPCPVKAFDTEGMMDSYAAVRSISLSSQDSLNVSINASLFASQPNESKTEQSRVGKGDGNVNQKSDHGSEGNRSNRELITEPDCTTTKEAVKQDLIEPDIGNVCHSRTTTESVKGANNDAIVGSPEYTNSSPSSTTSSTSCHLCSVMAANKRPSQIRSKDSMKRFLDTSPSQNSYICLLGTHLLYTANGWELTDDCVPCKEHDESTTDKYCRFNIGNGVICVWHPKSNNNPAMWLVKKVGASDDNINFDHNYVDDGDDDGERSSIEGSFELPSREPEVAQKNNTSPLHSIMNTIRERKSGVKEKYNIVIDSIHSDEIMDTLSNAKHHLVESAKLARSTFDSISENGIIQVEEKKFVSVDHGILPPALVDFQKLYIKPLQVIVLQISAEFENLPLLEQRNHGDDIKTSSIGWLIRNDLCTTLAKLLHVGLSTGRSLLKSLFGRVEEITLWKVVRDFSLAYGSPCFTTVVGYVERSRWLVNDDMKFRYFVCELLNRSTMDGSEKLIVTWFRNFPRQTNMVHKYYVPNSFWRMYCDEYFVLLVEEIVKSLMLLNGIPFHLHDFFEVQLLRLRKDSVRSLRAISHSGPQYPDEGEIDDIVCVFE